MNLKLKIYWWYYPRPELAVGYIPDIDAEDSIKRDLGNQISAERGDFATPPDIQEQLEIIQSELATFMEAPKAVNTGFEEVIPIQEVFDFRTFEDKPGAILFQYREIILPPKAIETKSMQLSIDQLSQVSRKAIEEINKFAYLLSIEDYVRRHGKTQEQVEQIVGPKRKVFVSYRARYRRFATKIYASLKSYANAAFLDPFIDHIDLGPGRWIDKLEKRLADLADGDGFLPILTLDYFDGPISSWEYDKAVTGAEERGVKIIPILNEGDIKDYEDKDKLITKYNVIKIRRGLDSKKYNAVIDKLVALVMYIEA